MNVFEFVKTKVSLKKVVGEYAKLENIGGYLRTPCPFHEKDGGSFIISPEKNAFYCFGCKEGGDIISFISKKEKCSPMDAVKFLIKRYKIVVPKAIKF